MKPADENTKNTMTDKAAFARWRDKMAGGAVMGIAAFGAAAIVAVGGHLVLNKGEKSTAPQRIDQPGKLVDQLSVFEIKARQELVDEVTKSARVVSQFIAGAKNVTGDACLAAVLNLQAKLDTPRTKAEEHLAGTAIDSLLSQKTDQQAPHQASVPGSSPSFTSLCVRGGPSAMKM